MADALEAPYPNNGHWTYADYKAWVLKPRERYEIIYGEAYAMSAPDLVVEILSPRSRGFQ